MVRSRQINLSGFQTLFRQLQRLPSSIQTVLVLLVTIYVLAGLGLEQVSAVFEIAERTTPSDSSSGLHFVVLLGFGLRYTPELVLILLIDMLVVRPLKIAPVFVLIIALWIMLVYGAACALFLNKLHIDPRLRRRLHDVSKHLKPKQPKTT